MEKRAQDTWWYFWPRNYIFGLGYLCEAIRQNFWRDFVKLFSAPKQLFGMSPHDNEVSIKDFFNKCDQIRRKSSIENFIFCVVSATKTEIATDIRLWTVIARFFGKLNIAFKFSFHQSIIHIEFVTCQLTHEILWHITSAR